MYFNFIPLSITLLHMQMKLLINHIFPRTCFLNTPNKQGLQKVDIFLSALDYNTPRCRQTIVCVESEVIGSDDSIIKIILNLSSSQKI